MMTKLVLNDLFNNLFAVNFIVCVRQKISEFTSCLTSDKQVNKES